MNNNDIRMMVKEALENLWSRIKVLFGGLDDRVTALEQGGGGGGGGDVTGVKGNEESTYRTGNVNLTPANIGALPDTTVIPSKTSDLTNDSGFISTETDPTVPSWAKQSTKPAYTASEVGAIPTTQKGAASGVAELDSGGKVPASQLPSYVDDVLEYSSRSAFPSTGETGKIYVALDTNLAYRWSGSAYVEISPSLALGETSSTAYRGDRGKAAYDHATDSGRLTTAAASGLYKVAVTAEGHVASATAVQKGDITGLGIPGQDTTYSAFTGASAGAAGTSGLVPAPSAGDNEKFLRGDGTWQAGGGGGGAVSGVKGDAESTYRTGNVNLTAANIGAKATQSAVSDPTASGTGLTFIDSITQDAQGVITPTKKTVQTATQSADGVMSSTDKAKLDGIAAGAQVNSITGVKGNAESSYRTGNVNLTPANIGAVDKSGDTMSGNLYITAAGEHYVKVTNTNTQCAIYLDSSSAKHGLWSNGYYDGSNYVSDGKWILWRDSSGSARLQVETATCNDSVYTTQHDTPINRLEKIGGMVHIMLQMNANNGVTFSTSTCFTVPAGFRPGGVTSIPMLVKKSGAYTPYICSIDALGNGWQNYSASVDGIYIDTWYPAAVLE